MSYVIRELKTVKSKVKYLLETYSATRGNDSYLCWLYLKTFTDIRLPYLDFQQFFSFNFESITRCRRKLQEKGKYLPNDQVIRGRRRRENKMKQAMWKI